MRAGSRLAGAMGVLVAAVALVGLRMGSLVSLPTAAAGESVLRLSWSARPERIEECRRRSDEEVEALPQHMRLRWECEGRFARYLLIVSVDGNVVASDTVRGSGLRSDRPMHLFREFGLVPGERHLEVMLRRLDAGTMPDTGTGMTAEGAAAADRETREAQERRARRAEALREVTTLDTVINIPSGRVALVSYAPTERMFVLRTTP